MRAEAGRQQAAQRGRNIQPWMWAIGGLVLGVILGIVYGWVIDPVVLTDVDPVDLRQDWKETWTLMAADSYSIRQNDELARQWFNTFPEDEQRELLTRLHSAAQVPEEQQKFEELAGALGVQIGGPTTLPEDGEPAEPAEEAAGGGLLRNILTICAVGLLLLLILLVVARFMVSRRREAGELRERPSREAPAYQPPRPQQPAEAEPTAAEEPAFDFDEEPGPAVSEDDLFDEAFFEEDFADEELPDTGPMPTIPESSLAEFTTRYQFGEDHYDMSFSIETSDATFLGECGVSISEVIEDDPNQHVTAFEVWLFDKDDIRTVTKVLMSEHAWQNDALRARLGDRGELIQLHEGETFELETKTLRVRVRVRGMEYGQNPNLPDRSFVDYLELELEPFQKANGESGSEGPSITY